MIDLKKCEIITCIGDNSRYSFAQELMPKGQVINTNFLSINKSYIFIYSEDEKVIEQDSLIYIYNKKVPIGKIIEVPISDYEVYSVALNQKKKIVGKILLFANFPYNKNSIHNMLVNIIDKVYTTDINIVLYKDPKKVSYTDIKDSESIINQANKDFGNKNVKIVNYEPKSLNKELFLIKGRYSQYYKNYFIKNFNSADYSIRNRFEINYKIFLDNTYDFFCSMNHPEEFSKFIKIFDYMYHSKSKNIWKSFVEKFKQEYFTGNYSIINDVLNFYLDYTKDLLNFNIANEKKVFLENIIKFFDSKMSEYKTYSVPNTELEYKELLNKINIVNEFIKRLEVFFYEELKKEMYKEINNKLTRIKSLTIKNP